METISRNKPKPEGKCQVEGCVSPAKYSLYKTEPNGQKVWLHVCIAHEGEIGSENIRRYYQ